MEGAEDDGAAAYAAADAARARRRKAMVAVRAAMAAVMVAAAWYVGRLAVHEQVVTVNAAACKSARFSVDTSTDTIGVTEVRTFTPTVLFELNNTTGITRSYGGRAG